MSRIVDPRYRLAVAVRTLAAAVGGYAVAALVAIDLALALPGPRIDAAAFGTIAAFLALPIAAMGCFWARSAARAWAGIALALLILGGIAFAAGWRP